MHSRTVSSARTASTIGRYPGSKAISEHVVRPARLSRAHSARSMAPKLLGSATPAKSGRIAPISSAVPSSSPLPSRPYFAPLGSAVSRVSPLSQAACELK
ncbi:Uncharacterised protein [Mycobacterium tuberculosis]|uniref:Uncharacterized protein n=1 Tax=Mycobacterium tuberculosis TaxID=1773 RepID=A0A655FXN2_MYCTX|nr:Uncharacterised protein [Mycobacterium tuberculosis]CFE82580.1 Uncharacterised protein [Mycobacterium tuberculosis]CFS31036.1 Uncharacterised protein [Mycobacterium tuberculosis]CKX02444.1 Uncharacterised protein [Mycobacterium tuberculosis]CNL48416.1 Uncharacterised protein [Mycobacterium tuberculosis]